MTLYPRLCMRTSLAERELPGDLRHRAVRSAEAATIGELMLAAYRGTVDDEGESLEDAVAEVERVFEGAYGPFVFEASFVVDDEGDPVGASLVALWESRPLLLYLVVRPEMKRRGIGTFLLARTGNALLAAGHPELDLFVTEANQPAVSLYRKLGFRVVERIEGPAGDAST